MKLQIPVAVFALSAALAACSSNRDDDVSLDDGGAGADDGDDDEGGDGGGGGEDDDGNGGEDGGDDDGDGGDDGGADDGDIKYDVGGGTGGPGDENKPCEKSDFLFVIDASGSMIDSQQKLAQSIPGFIDAVITSTSAKDFHVLVTDVDAEGNGTTGTCGGPCPQSALGIDFYFCNGEPCVPGLPVCEYTLGAGRRRTSDYTTECGLPGDQRYMDDTQPDKKGTFECLALLGGNGNNTEHVADSMVEALQGANGCNEGFLRDDAILIVVIVSDDADADRRLSTQEYYDALVGAKHGNPDAIVFLAFISDFDLPGSTCPMVNSSEGIPTHIRELSGMFAGDWTAHCHEDYGEFLFDQIGVINTVCEDFDPPG